MSRLFCAVFDIVMKGFSSWRRLSPLPTGKVHDRLLSVQIGTVNFYLLPHRSGYAAIDTGYCPMVIRRELTKLKIDPALITHILLTHSDVDHAGGLSVFNRSTIYLPALEEPLIRRQIPRKYGHIYNIFINRPYNLLQDDETLIINELRIDCIACPGHTPGSMAFLVDQKLLFTGDTIVLKNEVVRSPGAFYNMDSAQQLQSINKLTSLIGVEVAFTGHGGRFVINKGATGK